MSFQVVQMLLPHWTIHLLSKFSEFYKNFESFLEYFKEFFNEISRTHNNYSANFLGKCQEFIGIILKFFCEY